MAQNHFIGVHGGVNFTNVVKPDDWVTKTYNRKGLLIGLTYDYIFREHFSFGTGIMYNQRGYTYNLIFDPSYTGEPYDLIFIGRINRDFITIPLKLGYQYGKAFFGYFNIGLSPSLMVEAYAVYPKLDFNGNNIPERAVWNKDLLYKFDLAGFVEVGGGYMFTNGFGLNTSLMYQHSFTPILDYEKSPDSQMIHYGLSLNMGVKYALSKVKQ